VAGGDLMVQEPSGVSVWSPKIANEALVRKFVSLNGSGYLAITIQDQSQTPTIPVDPDPGSLNLAVWWRDVLTPPGSLSNVANNPYGTQILTVTSDSITNTDVGYYYYDIGPTYTANRGLLTAVWTYTVNSVPFQFIDHLQILDPMPLYDSLDASEQSVVDQVSWMFADLYDSTEGGPHLIEEFQTHWNSERIAQMMSIAVMRMNFIGNYGNAPTTWSVGSAASVASASTVTTTTLFNDGTTSVVETTPMGGASGSGVPSNMAGLLVLGTYIEVMRHLRDSYTEIPDRPGMDVVYTSRRDYQQRWAANLAAEEADWKQMVKNAKISLLSLSRGSLLVAGGIYGGSSLGIFQAGTYAAQVRSWRFYPAAPAISFGATKH
jgi:hypothetical protein